MRTAKCEELRTLEKDLLNNVLYGVVRNALRASGRYLQIAYGFFVFIVPAVYRPALDRTAHELLILEGGSQ